jgi:hypothetical protein
LTTLAASLGRRAGGAATGKVGTFRGQAGRCIVGGLRCACEDSAGAWRAGRAAEATIPGTPAGPCLVCWGE